MPPSAPLPILPVYTPAAPTPVGAVLGSLTGGPTATGNRISFFDTGGDPYFMAYAPLPVGALFSAGATGLPRVWKVLEVVARVLPYSVPLTVYILRLVDASDPTIVGGGDFFVSPGAARPVPLPTYSGYEFAVGTPNPVGSILGASAGSPAAPLPVLPSLSGGSAPTPVGAVLATATATTPTATGNLL